MGLSLSENSDFFGCVGLAVKSTGRKDQSSTLNLHYKKQGGRHAPT
jgi:hypothetical protein